TPERARQTRKTVIEKQNTSSDIAQVEYKPDHTYIELSGHVKTRSSIGSWSVSGNQLTMISVAEQKAAMDGRIYTFSITGNTMIRTMVNKAPYNTMVAKQEDTSIKM